VSSAHGPLHRLLLCFPREAVVRRGYRTVYAELFAKLPAETRLTVLVHPAAADELVQLLDAAERRSTTTIVRTGEDLRFTVWAQDPCVVLQGDGQTTLLVPAGFERQQDADTVALFAQVIGARVQRSSLPFHGGDVLTADVFVLVGRTCTAARSATFDAEDAAVGSDVPTHAVETERPELAERFGELVDPALRVHVVGTDRPLPVNRTRTIRVKGQDIIEVLPGGAQSPHPMIHLDMFLTLAGRGPDGRYRILVGSPAMADDLLGRSVVDSSLSEHLTDDGFEVLRNPLPLTYGDGRRDIDGELRDVRLWYLATSNNCLVQIDEGAGNRVWLPTYGHGPWKELAATDDANRRIWEQLGFTVTELTSFHTFAQRFGALHCIAKEFDRTPVA